MKPLNPWSPVKRRRRRRPKPRLRRCRFCGRTHRCRMRTRRSFKRPASPFDLELL